MHQRNMVEKVLEGILFKSRWLLAPFYLGLVLALVLLLGAFIAELMHFMPQLLDLAAIDPEQVILAVLSLIDLSLAGNLVVIVIFSGSIVAISAISLLRAFMTLTEDGAVLDERKMFWMLILHLTFFGSGLMFAAMDYIGNRSKKPKEH